MRYIYNKERKTVANVVDMLFNLDSFISGEVKVENFENTTLAKNITKIH